MAVELGTAYLSISASTRGMEKDIRNAVGQTSKSFDAAGKRGGEAIRKGLGRGLKIAGGAALGVAATLGGIALKGGFSRALNIEDAQAKLKGLGHDTKSIETIMDSALASVKGTAFGLGDAATVAASTVAAGVKPGEDLTRTLKLVADASTIAGTSMSDMGSIFNKVAGTGKIQGEVIAQLGERGIPILQLLADEMGVSAGEVAKMASKGEIDFERFQNAMEAGMGGAALKSGETFRGALANVGAALGRLGEKFAKPTLDALKSVFNDAIPAIDNLTDKIGPFAEKFGEWLGGAVEKAREGIPNLIEDIKGVWSILSGEGFQGADATFGLEEDSPIVGLLFTLREKFEELWAIGQQLFDRLAPVFEQLAPTVLDLLSAFSPLSLIFQVLEPVIPLIADALGTMGEVIGGALTQAMPDLSVAVESLAAGLVQVVEALMPLLPALLDLLPVLTPLIPPFAELVSEILPPLADLIVALVDPIVALLVPALGLLADYLTNIGVPALTKWWDILGAVVSGVAGAISGYLRWLAQFYEGTVEKFNYVREHIGEFPEAVKAIFANAGEWLYNAGREIVNGVTRGIESMWTSAKEKVQNLGSNIGNWFKQQLGIASPSKVFIGFGRDIVRGLGKGITDSRDVARKALDSLAALSIKAGQDMVKREADSLIKARQRQNERIRKANANRAKGAKAMPLLPTLTREQAEKQARKNLETELDALKKVRKMLRGQDKTTRSIWSEGTRSGVDTILAGLTKGGNIRGGAAGKAIRDLTLKDLARARESVRKSIDAAKATLKDLQEGRAQMRSQVAASIRGELDLREGISEATTDEYGRTSKPPTTFASVAGVVKAMAAKARTFANLLQRLAKAGIPAGLIQEVAGYGTEQGTEVARALLSGSATQIKALTQDYSALQKWSDAAGKHVAAATYDTAIAAQEGLLRGLEADDAKLEKAAQKLAKKLAKAVKKALKIKSPSQLFRDEVGLMLTEGVIDGIDKGQGALDARVAGMVGRPNVPSPTGMAGNSARNLTDADAQAIADAFARTTIKAVAYLDNQEARKVTQTGIQEIRRTDPAVLR